MSDLISHLDCVLVLILPPHQTKFSHLLTKVGEVVRRKLCGTIDET